MEPCLRYNKHSEMLVSTLPASSSSSSSSSVSLCLPNPSHSLPIYPVVITSMSLCPHLLCSNPSDPNLSLSLPTSLPYFCQSLVLHAAHSICLYSSLSPSFFVSLSSFLTICSQFQALFLGRCFFISWFLFFYLFLCSHSYLYLCISFKNLILFLCPQLPVSSSGLSGQFRLELV